MKLETVKEIIIAEFEENLVVGKLLYRDYGCDGADGCCGCCAGERLSEDSVRTFLSSALDTVEQEVKKDLTEKIEKLKMGDGSAQGNIIWKDRDDCVDDVLALITKKEEK
jgi:hypothetical protein